jgi:hypothetical protein
MGSGFFEKNCVGEVLVNDVSTRIAGGGSSGCVDIMSIEPEAITGVRVSRI